MNAKVAIQFNLPLVMTACSGVVCVFAKFSKYSGDFLMYSAIPTQQNTALNHPKIKPPVRRLMQQQQLSVLKQPIVQLKRHFMTVIWCSLPTRKKKKLNEFSTAWIETVICWQNTKLKITIIKFCVVCYVINFFARMKIKINRVHNSTKSANQSNLSVLLFMKRKRTYIK